MTLVRVGDNLVDPGDVVHVQPISHSRVWLGEGLPPLHMYLRHRQEPVIVRGVTLEDFHHAVNWPMTPPRSWTSEQMQQWPPLPPTPEGLTFAELTQDLLDAWGDKWTHWAARPEDACGAAPNLEWITRMAEHGITTVIPCALAKGHETNSHNMPVASHGEPIARSAVNLMVYAIMLGDAWKGEAP